MEPLLLTPFPAVVTVTKGSNHRHLFAMDSGQNKEEKIAQKLLGDKGELAISFEPPTPTLDDEYKEYYTHPEGYLLDIAPDSVRIIATTGAGYFYGVVTLKQLINQFGNGNLPCLLIADKPQWAHRGSQVTYAQINLEYREDYLKHFIEEMAMLKINTVYLYIEWRFQFPSIPMTQINENISPQEVRKITEYAKDYHITIAPSLNVLGHTDDFLGSQCWNDLKEYDAELGESRVGEAKALCPTNPGTRALIEQALQDIMDTFDCPIIHVGGDEVPLMGACPLCKPREKEIGVTGIYLEYYGWIRDLLKARGRIMGIWGDMIAHYAGKNPYYPNKMDHTDFAKFLTLRENTIIFDWSYDGPAKESVEGFVDAGYSVICSTSVHGCSTATPWLGQYVNQRDYFIDGYNKQISGGLVTDWINGYGYHSEQMGVNYASAAAMMWQGTDSQFAIGTTYNEFIGAYALQAHGCKNDSLPRYWHAAGDRDSRLLKHFKGTKNGSYLRKMVYLNASPLCVFLHYAGSLRGDNAEDFAQGVEELESLWNEVEGSVRPNRWLPFLKGPVILFRCFYEKYKLAEDFYQIYNQAAKVQYTDEKGFARLLDEACHSLESYRFTFDEAKEFAQLCYDELGMEQGSILRLQESKDNLEKLIAFTAHLKNNHRPLPTLQNLNMWLFYPSSTGFSNPRNDEWFAETPEFRATETDGGYEWGSARW